jgi:hypothetical protein
MGVECRKCTYININVQINAKKYVYKSRYIYIINEVNYAHICKHIYIYINTYIIICIYMCVSMYVCMYACMHGLCQYATSYKHVYAAC